MGAEEVWKDGKDAEAGELGAEEGARMEWRQIQEDCRGRIERRQRIGEKCSEAERWETEEG